MEEKLLMTEKFPLSPRVEQALERHREAILSISRTLFENPELSGEERQSVAFLASVLKEHGFEVTQPVGGLETAFRAERRGRSERPRVAYLAEYDALPDEIGHGCGHNLIAAASTGAALALGDVIGELEGSVVLLGTPAEETIGGKIEMLRAGAFEDIDTAMMVHPSNETRVNTTSLAAYPVEVIFYGKEAHAASSPELGINALDALVTFYVSLGLLQKQLRSDVRFPGIIKEGGTRQNIVPARAVGIFSVRAADTDYLDYVIERIRETAQAAAQAHGARFEVRHPENYFYEMCTNQALAEVCGRHIEEGGLSLIRTPRKKMGSLDMGTVSHTLPAIHPMISVCDELSAHTPEFGRATQSERGQHALLVAARALALTGLAYLSSDDLRRRVHEEFAQAKKKASARKAS
ncbi:MAG: M20 family metallopeptidase [Acidobacteriota bacterium]|nr:MAG: M20 family metallopeptidase [Acidobacteriota bacterium]